MSPILTVDRIEGDMVVIETPSGLYDLPLSCFNWNISEGDKIAVEKVEHSENEMQNSMDRLKRLTAKGDKSDIIDL